MYNTKQHDESSIFYPHSNIVEYNFRTKEANSAEFMDRKSKSVKIKHSGGDTVDDLLKTYIEKVDRDQNSLRDDIRESEKRTESRINSSEDRMDARLVRIESMIEKQNEKLEEIKKEVGDKNGENKRFMWGIVVTILLSILASVGVIVATYFSTISLLQNMLK